MDLSKGILLTGLPITFKNPLRTIHQPRLNEIYSAGLSVTDFMKPFTMIELNKEGFEIAEYPLLYFFKVTEKLRVETKWNVEVDFFKSLSLLYKTNIANIKVLKTTKSIIIKVLDDEENELGLITDENILELTHTVLKMLDIIVDSKKEEVQGDKETLDKFEQRKREYEAKKRQKLIDKGINPDFVDAEKDEVGFYNMINFVIHQQTTVDYDKVMNLTVWQLKNSYSTLMLKMATNRFIDSGSVQYNPDGKLKDWVEESKYK